MRMADGALLYCNRCTSDVEVVRPWSGYVWLKRGWFASLALLLLLGPIIMSEITLLLPLAMVFAAAGGPLLSLSGEKQTCRDCGAQIGARVSSPHAKPDSSQTR
jgi:hypothetical protein